MVQIPQFVKEIVWAFYPPRYKQLSQKPIYRSIGFMTRMLVIAFLLAGIVFLPKLFTLKSTIESQFKTFDEFTLSSKITQHDQFTVPVNNPWIRVDFNNNLTLKDELFVIDTSSVQYRLLNPNRIDQDQLKHPTEHTLAASRFVGTLVLLLIPGVALVLFVRSWLRYVLLVVTFGTLFFVIIDLTRYKMKWRQMMSVAAHAISPIIILEVVASAISTRFLLPVPLVRFLGLKFYAVTLLLFGVMMMLAVLGCRIEDARKK